MAGKIAGFTLGAPTGSKKWRIADNAVVAAIGRWLKLLQRRAVQVQPRRPRACGEIAGRILTGAGIEFERIDVGAAALRQHQAEQAGASADIKNVPAVGYRHIGTEQTGMGGDLHAGMPLLHPELFELKPGIVFARAHLGLRLARIVTVAVGADQARELRLCRPDNSRHTAR